MSEDFGLIIFEISKPLHFVSISIMDSRTALWEDDSSDET